MQRLNSSRTHDSDTDTDTDLYTSDADLSTAESDLNSGSGSRDTETSTPMKIGGIDALENQTSYFHVNLSDLIKSIKSRNHLDKLHQNIIKLDRKVAVGCDGKYSEIAEGVEKLMVYISYRMKLKGYIIKSKRTGSFYARIKVGLPLEADYVFEIKKCNAKKFYFRDFISEVNCCIENLVHVKYKYIRYKIIQKTETRVSYSFALECRDVNSNMREGFSIDIVPAKKVSDRDISKIEYAKGAWDFIQNCEIEYDHYPIQLLSTGRDSHCDLGLLKHTIFKSLDEETKRQLRIAKYLFIRALCVHEQPLTTIHGIDRVDNRRLFGCKTFLSSSFHLCSGFLHILVAAQEMNITAALDNGILTLCTLELMKRMFEFFAAAQEQGSRFMQDPLDANMKYENHLSVRKNVFNDCAKDIDKEVDKFLKSGNLDEFNIRVFEKTDTECDRYLYPVLFVFVISY